MLYTVIGLLITIGVIALMLIAFIAKLYNDLVKLRN